MHKLSNFTGQARHGWEKMTPSMGFGVSRSQHGEMPMGQPMKRPSMGAASSSSSSPGPQPGALINLSFNVPFNSNLGGPDVDDIIYSSPGAVARWTHLEPEGTAEDAPNHKLPVHQQHVENLRALCRQMSETSGGRLQASVVSSEPKPIPGLQRGPLKALVTNVCLSGESELVQKMRAKILNETPISLRCATVDIDEHHVVDNNADAVRAAVLNHMDEVAKITKADIFLLKAKQPDDSASMTGNLDLGTDQRLRCLVYGDMETAEFAKTRILIMIDQILHRSVDIIPIELTLQSMVSGRARKNIKLIESQTNTAIYFPPAFPGLYGYVPPGAIRRAPDEIIVTGESSDEIQQAKRKLLDLVQSTKCFTKDVVVTVSKIDSILLERLDKVKKIIENNGSYVLFPPLGLQRGPVRVQGTDILNVERTVREVMSLAGQFYSASWWITHPDPSQRPPTPSDIRMMLSDICINSGAEITFEKFNFHISGSDDAVKAAMMVINNIPFVNKSQYTMRVKLELANEHKEFVSGKKNGKINKIMSHSNVQIVFDGFNEYNFYIDVRGSQYDATKSGLDLVEQEMPASIAFHVPDQYHKRIIGIGGQHIQRIMKKYSVFVKFSNAMDRGGVGKEEDDMKVDNVICRTPARNAGSLDMVKQEIMDMVEKVDAEFVSEIVLIDRLYHRQLIARMNEIEELEKKWNCKIIFPSAEQASDIVTVNGPEYQVPQAVDEFLGMVPESHEIAFPAAKGLKEYLRSPEFQDEIVEKMQSQYVVRVTQAKIEQEAPAEGSEATIEGLVLNYTRNNAGGLKDALDYLISRLVAHGLDAAAIKGAISRPKSDSFEDSLPFFESKLLQRAEPPVMTDSPTRSHFGDENGEQPGFFSRIRKPGSMSSFSSFIERRKNGSNSPGSLFKHASSNASKASLVSLESQGSYRNPWNDSGINLPDDDNHHHNGFANGWTSGAPAARHTPYESKFPFGLNGNGSASAVSTGPPAPGDATPTSRHDPRHSFDSGRPSTSHSATAGSSATGYPGPIGPPR